MSPESRGSCGEERQKEEVQKEAPRRRQELKELAPPAGGPDFGQGVESSLQATVLALKWDELENSEERHNLVEQTYNELSDYAKRLAAGESSTSSSSSSSYSSSSSRTRDPGPSAEVEPMADGAAKGRLTRVGTQLSLASTVESSEELNGFAPFEGTEEEAEAEASGEGDMEMQDCAVKFLNSFRVRPHEVGSRNYSKWRGRTLWNQCFYLSMAHAYLGQQASTRRVRGLARRMRRAIEAVVLEKHPAWAKGLKASASGTGQAMVFADFLPLAMRSGTIPEERNLLAKLAVCIMDSVNGHCEVYIGPGYSKLEDRSEQVNNLLLLWYKPAHYQALVRNDDVGSKMDCTYDEFKSSLMEHGVVFIETTE